MPKKKKKIVVKVGNNKRKKQILNPNLKFNAKYQRRGKTKHLKKPIYQARKSN